MKLGSVVAILTWLLNFSLAYEIVKSPDKVIWADEGEELELTCESAEPWQWCYWEVTKTSDQDTMKYATFFDHPGEESIYNDDGVKFVIDTYTCGIHLKPVNHLLHDGYWKCHLADTDVNRTKNFADAFTDLKVSWESSMDFTWSIGDSDVSPNGKWPFNHLLGDNVILDCQADPLANPKPFLSLLSVDSEGVHTQLMDSTMSEEHHLKHFFELTKMDDSTYFICIMTQTMEGSDQVYFKNEIASDNINLAYPPMLDIFDHPPYIFSNESITVPILFSAKPMPEDEDIVWTILSGDDKFYNEPGMEDPSFLAYPMEYTETADEYIVSLVVKNITNDVLLVCNIRNSFGDVTQEVSVIYSPPQKQVVVVKEGIALWVILLIVGIIVLLILCGFFVGCSRRKYQRVRRETEVKKEFDNRVHHFVQQEKNRKKHGGGVPVNLDDIPDQNLPILAQGISQMTGVDPKFHRSLSTAHGSNINNHNVTDLDDEVASINSSILYNQPVNNSIEETESRDTIDRGIRPEPKPRSGVNHPGALDSFASADADFNEELLNVENNPDVNPLSSFKPMEPNLSLRRQPGQPAMTIELRRHHVVTASSRTTTMTTTTNNEEAVYPGPHGDLLRLGGITGYPVITPSPRDYIPPQASTIPGRRTPSINYNNPKDINL